MKYPLLRRWAEKNFPTRSISKGPSFRFPSLTLRIEISKFVFVARLTSFLVWLGFLVVTFVLGTSSSLHAQLTNHSDGTKSTRTVPDPRHLTNGFEIPSKGYADQPYIVKTDDGAWLCAITTGTGHEGDAGQHIVSMRSTDRGRSWESPVDIEPSNGPEASYVVLLKTPYGRIYALYNHNTDNVREVRREDQGVFSRVDSLGYYVFKYSDDHGRSWSPQRYNIPVRYFECDSNNVYGGDLRFFWNVGRPLVVGDTAFMTLHKVCAMGQGFFAQSEGAILKSTNILSERDPEKIVFETLPDGNVGLRTPVGGGRVAEEQSLARLSDGSIFCVYRTIDGWPTCAYSHDGGHHWTPPQYMTYQPDGLQRVKNPRAANFVWNCSNGMFLYWFHNHGGRFIGELGAGGKDGRSPYDDRNPAWLMAGREVETPDGKRIEWSQPEILLYDDDPFIRMSYPDLVEEQGKFYVTETQKNIARVHEIPDSLVQGLFNQWNPVGVNQEGLLLESDGVQKKVNIPKLPALHLRDGSRADQAGKDMRAGFSIDLWLQLDSLAAGQVLLDSRDSTGAGILVSISDSESVHLAMHDGREQVAWESDRGVIQIGKPQHVVITVDGGPKVITFVVNGILCDGGDQRQFGWGRYSPTLRTPNGKTEIDLGEPIKSLRIYGRALRTSEAIGNFNAANLSK